MWEVEKKAQVEESAREVVDTFVARTFLRFVSRHAAYVRDAPRMRNHERPPAGGLLLARVAFLFRVSFAPDAVAHV